MRKAIRLIAFAALGGLVACGRAPSLDPPKVLQLACLPDGGQDGMVLVFDTARKSVSWANAPTAVRGAYSSTPMDYRFQLPATGSARQVRGVVNRFDGRLRLDWGAAAGKPVAGDIAAGPDRRVWRCRKQVSGPLL